jgi:hypothetical protein
MDRITRTARWMLLAAAGACSSLPEEYQPIIDSLHTPEMEAAIKAARGDPQAQPAANRNP